jgi:hypothetical protein
VNPQDAPQLRDIHLPPDPGWWPPAPGWWLLAFVLLALGAFALRHARRALRVRRWRRRLLAELDRLVAAHSAKPDAAQFVADLSRLLRRAARQLDPRAATLRGDAWLDFLDRRLPSGRTPVRSFRHEAAHGLADAAYRPAHDPALQAVDAAALAALARAWLAGNAAELAHA